MWGFVTCGLGLYTYLSLPPSSNPACRPPWESHLNVSSDVGDLWAEILECIVKVSTGVSIRTLIYFSKDCM